MEFFTNKFFLIAVTFISYVSAVIVQRRTGLRLLNPILISIAVMICLLMGLGIDYDTYQGAGE